MTEAGSQPAPRSGAWSGRVRPHRPQALSARLRKAPQSLAEAWIQQSQKDGWTARIRSTKCAAPGARRALLGFLNSGSAPGSGVRLSPLPSNDRQSFRHRPFLLAYRNNEFLLVFQAWVQCHLLREAPATRVQCHLLREAPASRSPKPCLRVLQRHSPCPWAPASYSAGSRGSSPLDWELLEGRNWIGFVFISPAPSSAWGPKDAQ